LRCAREYILSSHRWTSFRAPGALIKFRNPGLRSPCASLPFRSGEWCQEPFCFVATATDVNGAQTTASWWVAIDNHHLGGTRRNVLMQWRHALRRRIKEEVWCQRRYGVRNHF